MYPEAPGWLVGRPNDPKLDGQEEQNEGSTGNNAFANNSMENFDAKNDVVAVSGDILSRVDQLLQEIDVGEEQYGFGKFQALNNQEEVQESVVHKTIEDSVVSVVHKNQEENSVVQMPQTQVNNSYQ